MATKRFVKSADTDTPASRSQSQLENLLRRYGASGFGVQSDYEHHTIRVMFRVPDVPGGQLVVPIRLEVSIEAIAEALFGGLRGREQWSARGWEQAERVAWRHLVLWVDAACAATTAGLQTMSEAFLAHALVKAPDGTVKRVVELLNDVAGDGGYRGLLQAGPSR